VRNLRRAFDVVLPLVIAGVMLIAALPRRYLGPLADAERCGSEGKSCKSMLVDELRAISVSQNWGMYAPAPSRAHAYMLLTAIEPDGTERPLEENEIAEDGWGTSWMWDKDRLDILRHAVGFFRADKPNRNRTWFMRGICVREYRRGFEPVQIRMERVRRGFTPPDKVRAGKPVLGRPNTKQVQIMGCNARIVREMIEEDRARHGED
jgi:hypothetical protein